MLKQFLINDIGDNFIFSSEIPGKISNFFEQYLRNKAFFEDKGSNFEEIEKISFSKLLILNLHSKLKELKGGFIDIQQIFHCLIL